MRPGQGALAAVLIVSTLLALAGCGLLAEERGLPHADAGGLARVARVVDGDTAILSQGLGSSRLVGLDTPETATVVECFGPQASAFTKRVLEKGSEVRYRIAREPVDRYGRTLLYIWLPDGRFFNAMLVRGGYARPLTIPPNTRYAPFFRRLAEEAARAGRGLWARC